MARTWRLLLAVAWFAAAQQAQAQTKGDDFSLDEPGASQEPAPPPPAEGEPTLLSDEQALQEEAAPKEQFRQSSDPHEDPDKAYYFAGAGWRYLFIPHGVMDWFLESGPSVGTAGSLVGEFAWRKNGFQVLGQVGWMKFNFNGPFQLSGDPVTDTEIIQGRFNLLLTTASFTWSTAFTDMLALEYGVEAGVASVFGSLTRTEGYKDANGKWAACPGYAYGPNLPNPTPQQAAAGYCDTPVPEGNDQHPITNSATHVGAQYGVKAPFGLAHKGIPHAVPLVGPKLSLRFKPWHQLVIRADFGLLAPLAMTGGISAQFGF